MFGKYWFKNSCQKYFAFGFHGNLHIYDEWVEWIVQDAELSATMFHVNKLRKKILNEMRKSLTFYMWDRDRLINHIIKAKGNVFRRQKRTFRWKSKLNFPFEILYFLGWKLRHNPDSENFEITRGKPNNEWGKEI